MRFTLKDPSWFGSRIPAKADRFRLSNGRTHETEAHSTGQSVSYEILKSTKV